MSTQTSHLNTIPPLEGLNQTLEIELVEATRERVVMRMPITPCHCYPWGACLILAERSVSVGVFLNCPADMGAFGQQIHAKHLRSLREEVMAATAIPLHVRCTSQVWEIKSRNEREKLLCVLRCTLAVVSILERGNALKHVRKKER